MPRGWPLSDLLGAPNLARASETSGCESATDQNAALQRPQATRFKRVRSLMRAWLPRPAGRARGRRLAPRGRSTAGRDAESSAASAAP